MQTFEHSLENTFHLRLVKTPADGNCLFHAAALALARGMMAFRLDHVSIRAAVVDFLRRNKECFRAFQVDEAYLARMSTAGVWGGEPELVALSNVYVRSIEVYMFAPTGAAVHVRTYTPVLGVESAAPMRFALLPVSGRLADSPNHYSYLEQVATVLGAMQVPAVPAPAAVEVDLACYEAMPLEDEEDVSVASLPMYEGVPSISEIRAEVVAAEGLLAVQTGAGEGACEGGAGGDEGAADAPVVAKAEKRTTVSYYKLYEHYLHYQGLPSACADLAARGEVAWYSCTCGECRRAAPFGSDVWKNIVCNEAPVKMTCKVWKPWSMYQTVVRPKLGL